MRHGLAILLLLVSGPLLANPYDGQVTVFENGKKAVKTYHQLLREKSPEGLSPFSKLVHERALEVFNDPISSELKKRYLAGFPRSFAAFLDIFHPKALDQLYDGYIYIHLVDSLASEYPESVGEIYLRLSSEACLDADAPNYLRHNLAAFEQRHPFVYKNYYMKLNPEQQLNIELFKGASLHDGGKGVCNF